MSNPFSATTKSPYSDKQCGQSALLHDGPVSYYTFKQKRNKGSMLNRLFAVLCFVEADHVASCLAREDGVEILKK